MVAIVSDKNGERFVHGCVDVLATAMVYMLIGVDMRRSCEPYGFDYYCRGRGMDIRLRPVNAPPRWSDDPPSVELTVDKDIYFVVDRADRARILCVLETLGCWVRRNDKDGIMFLDGRDVATANRFHLEFGEVPAPDYTCSLNR